MRYILALGLVVVLGLPAKAQTAADGTCPACPCAVEGGIEALKGECCGDCICCTPPRPAWYTRTDFIMLRRDVHGVPVAKLDTLLDDGIFPQTTVLSTNDFEEPFRPGAALLIGHTLGDSPYQIEFSYFTVSDWNQSASVRDATPNASGSAGNLFSPFTNFGNPVGLPGFDYNNFVSIRETSDLNSAEINVRHALPMPTRCLAVSWLVGVRHFGIDEQFDYLSQSAVSAPAGSSLGLHTRTHNNLWGGQIGGLFEFYAQNNCWINFEIKGALCSNSTSQETKGLIFGAGVPPVINGDRSDNTTSYVGDLSLMLVYRPTRHLATRIGYQALWIDGLTLAAANFAPPAAILLDGPPAINTSGNAVYHGPHAGLELSW